MMDDLKKDMLIRIVAPKKKKSIQKELDYEAVRTSTLRFPKDTQEASQL